MARSGRKDDEKLREIVGRVIHTRRRTPRISPTWVANEAMFDLDRTREVERRFVLIWIGCNLQLRQMARGMLASKYNYREDERDRDSLFPDLQWRYPTAHSAEFEEPEYVLRNMMSDEDVTYNVARLRSEAAAKNKHADALEAWHRGRR
jgi:hypothetical protein